MSRWDLEGVFFEGANLKGASLFQTNLKNVDLSGIISLDSVKIDRSDWLYFIKDSLNLNGAEKIIKDYKVDSVKLNSDSKVLMLLKKE